MRRLALALPFVEESVSYGTPGFRVCGKLFARLHQDGESLVVRVDADARDALMGAFPDTFYVTDHYAGHPWVLVRLAKVRSSQLREVLEDAWRLRAPKRLVERR